MNLHRSKTLLAFTALLGALGASGAAAQPISVRIYPTQAPADAQDAAADVESLLESALARVGSRSEHLRAASPALARRACGAQPATACLADLAGDGIILASTIRSTAATLHVSIRAIDARGRTHGPVQATVDAFLQSSEPLLRALLALEATMFEPADERASAPSPSPPRSPGARELAPRAPPPPPPALAAARPEPGYPREETGGWRRSAGKWSLGAGVVLLAGGVAAAGAAQKLTADLDAKYARNQLTRADATDYRRVDTYALVANSLLAAGGAFSAAGLWLWATAPEAEGDRGTLRVGISGRF